ncbi:hypothetical protein D3C79_296080 [compost metagenome]
MQVFGHPTASFLAIFVHCLAQQLLVLLDHIVQMRRECIEAHHQRMEVRRCHVLAAVVVAGTSVLVTQHDLEQRDQVLTGFLGRVLHAQQFVLVGQQLIENRELELGGTQDAVLVTFAQADGDQALLRLRPDTQDDLLQELVRTSVHAGDLLQVLGRRSVQATMLAVSGGHTPQLGDQLHRDHGQLEHDLVTHGLDHVRFATGDVLGQRVVHNHPLVVTAQVLGSRQHHALLTNHERTVTVLAQYATEVAFARFVDDPDRIEHSGIELMEIHALLP